MPHLARTRRSQDLVGQPEVSPLLAGGVVVIVFVFVFVVVDVVVVVWSTCSANLWVVSVTAPRQPPRHQATKPPSPHHA